MKRFVAVVMLLGMVGSSMAQQSMKPEDMIKMRKAGMDFLAWNFGKIKANVDGDFDKSQAVAAANVVAATGASGIFSLFAAGTEKDIGAERTHTKPALFEQPEKLKELAMALERETGELAKVTASGDVAAIKAQFGKTGRTCKECHDLFKAK